MPTTHNGDIELYYETFGLPVDGAEDPAIICLPGMGNQLLVYPEEFCLALVDRGFFVIRMDNRDAGLSAKTDASLAYTLSDMAADTVAVLDAAGVGHAVVLGLSLGGMIAQQTAVEHPDRLRALVSLAGGESGLVRRGTTPCLLPGALRAIVRSGRRPTPVRSGDAHPVAGRGPRSARDSDPGGSWGE